MGVDDQPLRCEYAPVPLTSVSPAPRQMGEAAADLLAALLAGAAMPARPLLVPPAGVVPRASTGRVLHDDVVVDAALRLMRDPAQWPLTASVVADVVGVSRRALERRFADVLGRSPGAVLREARMSAARSMVESGRLPLWEVAARGGFGSPGNFSRAFKSAYGVPPGAHRRRGGAASEAL